MLSLKNITYISDKKTILNNVSLTVFQGDIIYITGPSGAGKTSILKLLYMDILPTAGEVIVGEYSSRKIKMRQIPFLRRKMGIIFQDFRLLRDRNIYHNLAFVLQVTREIQEFIPQKVQSALKLVDLLHKQYDMPSSLSGGEQQKVAIARAIVREPNVILADEPTANLDAKSAEEIMNILHKLTKRNIAVIIVTHDHDIISRFPAKTYLIENGKLEAVEIETSR